MYWCNQQEQYFVTPDDTAGEIAYEGMMAYCHLYLHQHDAYVGATKHEPELKLPLVHDGNEIVVVESFVSKKPAASRADFKPQVTAPRPMH